MSRIPKQAKILGALIAVGFAVPAVACQPGPKDWSLTVDHMSESADLIVKGQLVRGNQSDRSIISVRVEETIKGPVRERWSLQFSGFRSDHHYRWLSGKRKNSDSTGSIQGPIPSVIIGAKRIESSNRESVSNAPEFTVMGSSWPCYNAFIYGNWLFLETRLKIAFAMLGGKQARERDMLLREEFRFSGNPWPGKSLVNLISRSMWRFHRLDLDGDGLTSEDIRDVSAIIEAQRPYRGADFRFSDLNGNGSIDENEITRTLKYTAATSDADSIRIRTQQQFRKILKFDVDGDGIIQLTELPPRSEKPLGSRQVRELEERRRNLQSVVRVFDANGDGVVGEPEFVDQLKEAFRFYDQDGNGIADDFD